MAEISRPELCIIGAGALGISLAQHARRFGASVVLVDRGIAEPGDGPHQALRLAALVASAGGAALMRNAGRLGLGAVDPKPSVRAIQERAQQVAHERAPADSLERLTALGIDVLKGSPAFSDASVLSVGQVQIRAQAYIIAVGGASVVPDIPGLADVDYLTPDSVLDNSRKLTHLLVVGACSDALVLAQIYARLGSQVTVVPQGAALTGYDMETGSFLLDALAREGVRVLDGAQLRDIQPRSQGIGATVEVADGGLEALDLSHVLIASGRMADLSTLNVDAARLRQVRGEERRFFADVSGRTSNRRVFLTGAAAGLDQWQQAFAHGRSVVDALVQGSSRHRSLQVPLLLQTDPPIAQFGRLPVDGAKLSAGHRLVRANQAENDLVRATGQSGGLVKVLVGPKGHVLGASVVGPGAGELAGVLALAAEQGLTLESLAHLPLPNPSLMSSLTALCENRIAVRPVSPFTKRRGEIMRLLRI